MQPPPVLFLGSDLWSQSLSSQPPSAPADEQTRLSGWLVLVSTDPLCGNLSALPSATVLLCSPPWLWSFPSATLRLHQWRGFLVCGNFSPSQLPPRGAGPVPILLSLFFLFSFVLPRYVGSFFPFGKSEVFCQRLVGCSVGVVPHVDVFLMYLWGGRWSTHLTPLPSWRSPPIVYFYSNNTICNYSFREHKEHSGLPMLWTGIMLQMNYV